MNRQGKILLDLAMRKWHILVASQSAASTEKPDVIARLGQTTTKLETLAQLSPKRGTPITHLAAIQRERSKSSSSSSYGLQTQKEVSPMSKDELEKKEMIQAKTEALETINDQSSLDQGTAAEEHTRPRSPGNK